VPDDIVTEPAHHTQCWLYKAEEVQI